MERAKAMSSQLATLVVDDEPLAREGLAMLLHEDPSIGEIRQARNGEEAVTLIREFAPDIVFLDVQMPEMDGFEVLEKLDTAGMPAIIFVTAHDQYAIRAFEINAIDYLLKPVSRERFSQALTRARLRRASGESDERVLSLLETLTTPRKYINRLAVRSAGKTYFVDLNDVEWMQSAENYVQLHAGASRHLVHVPIQTLQASLDPEVFLRIHRSLIVNLNQVKEIESATHGEFVLILHSGARLQSSRTYHEALKRWISNPF